MESGGKLGRRFELSGFGRAPARARKSLPSERGNVLLLYPLHQPAEPDVGTPWSPVLSRGVWDHASSTECVSDDPRQAPSTTQRSFPSLLTERTANTPSCRLTCCCGGFGCEHVCRARGACAGPACFEASGQSVECGPATDPHPHPHPHANPHSGPASSSDPSSSDHAVGSARAGGGASAGNQAGGEAGRTAKWGAACCG